MRFTYFNECKNLEDVKKAFRALAKQHHPDLGGNAEVFKTINNEYEEVFEYFKNEFNNKTENAKKKNKETPKEFKDIINILIKLDGLEIEICNTWLWLSGNTYIHRETLKELKFKWSKSKKKWYFYNGIEENSKIKGSKTMEEIRNKYGSERIESVGIKKLA